MMAVSSATIMNQRVAPVPTVRTGPGPGPDRIGSDRRNSLWWIRWILQFFADMSFKVEKNKFVFLVCFLPFLLTNFLLIFKFEFLELFVLSDLVLVLKMSAFWCQLLSIKRNKNKLEEIKISKINQFLTNDYFPITLLALLHFSRLSY
jgi:hypothetical protein